MKSAIKITIIYLVIGIAWIIISDKVAYYFFGDFEIYTQNLFQILKGIFYVVTTAIILFILINSFNRKIEEKVREQEMLNSTLEFERNKLKESNDQLEHFADMTSHDLKSPLRTILSLIQRYKIKFKDSLTPKSSEYLDVIEVSAKQLSRKIDKTLLFSKIAHSSGDFETIQPEEFIRDIELALANIIEEKNAKISIEKLPVIFSDRIMLQQVFQNIIENSIKYSKPNTEPAINISATKKEKKVIFEISDNGIGIPKEEQEKVFERFKQLDNKEFLKGNGIGLASIKRIINKLNGDIWIQSTEGEGTSVFVALPNE